MSRIIKATWLIVFSSVVVLDVDYGLVIGVGISILGIILRDQFVQIRQLIKYDELGNFVDKNLVSGLNYKESKQSLNVKVFKVQHSIYFVNCEHFKKRLFKSYGFSPVDALLDKKLDPGNEELVKTNADIILDFSAVNYIDTNGVKSVKEIVDDFKRIRISVYICEPQGEQYFKY